MFSGMWDSMEALRGASKTPGDSERLPRQRHHIGLLRDKWSSYRQVHREEEASRRTGVSWQREQTESSAYGRRKTRSASRMCKEPSMAVPFGSVARPGHRRVGAGPRALTES